MIGYVEAAISVMCCRLKVAGGHHERGAEVGGCMGRLREIKGHTNSQSYSS